MDFSKCTSLLAIALETLSNSSESSIIKLPKSAKYSLQDTLNVILHAATSSTNSPESASNDLKLKNPDKRIPSSDTINNYIKSNSIEYILFAYRKINSNLIDMLNLRGTTHDVAIDFHDIPYYGDKNTPAVRGIKAKNGTSWGYSFCTIDMIGSTKLTLDVIDINGLAKNYGVLIESLLKRVSGMDIQIGTLFMDREFFHIDPISIAHKLHVNYVIAARSNKKINRILDEHKKKFGVTSTIFKYNFDKGGPTFNIVAVVNPDYDPKAKKGNGNKEYHLFATNLEMNSISEFIKKIPEEYRKRWNIETGYRVKNEFKIRTCSTSPVARTFFFVLQCILYNILNVLKTGVDITASELKSAIGTDIFQFIRCGYDSLCAIPFDIFLKRVMEYNENRIKMLRIRLTNS